MSPLGGEQSRQGPAGHTSTHLSSVLVQALTVITLTEVSRHQAPVVLIGTHAAATVAGACQGN